MRKILLLAGIALIAAALFFVPLPLVELTAGGALSVPERIELQPSENVDVDIGEINGALLLTTVRLESPTAIEALETWIDDTESLTTRRSVVPPNIDPEEFARQQRRLFEESARVASAVAQRAAGFDVTVSGDGARVVGVLPGSPAEGNLQGGDVVVEVEGREIELASDVGVAIADMGTGQEVELVVERDGEEMTVTLTLEELSELGQAGIGVALQTVDQNIDLPIEVEVDSQQIGGPSGGLMLALAIYDLIVDEDVTDGRTIAGTGTIDANGGVGPIAGIEQKVVSAEREGADIFLVPASQADAARSVASADLEVIAVEEFDGALRALEGTASG